LTITQPETLTLTRNANTDTDTNPIYPNSRYVTLYKNAAYETLGYENVRVRNVVFLKCSDMARV